MDRGLKLSQTVAIDLERDVIEKRPAGERSAPRGSVHPLRSRSVLIIQKSGRDLRRDWNTRRRRKRKSDVFLVNLALESGKQERGKDLFQISSFLIFTSYFAALLLTS
jgi:hypothetical protein